MLGKHCVIFKIQVLYHKIAVGEKRWTIYNVACIFSMRNIRKVRWPEKINMLIHIPSTRICIIVICTAQAITESYDVLLRMWSNCFVRSFSIHGALYAIKNFICFDLIRFHAGTCPMATGHIKFWIGILFENLFSNRKRRKNRFVKQRHCDSIRYAINISNNWPICAFHFCYL